MSKFESECVESNREMEVRGKLHPRRLLWTTSQLRTSNILKQMAEQGAVPSSQHVANAIKNNNLLTLRLLIDNCAPIDETHLSQAISLNSIGMVKEILKHLFPNDEHLFEAIAIGNLKIISLLTERMSPNDQHLAISTGKVKKQLLRAEFRN